MQLVAKGVLSRFKAEFHEERVWATLRYLGDRVSTAFSELNPIVIRNTDKNHLLDPDFHLSAFQYREKRLLHSIGRRMRGLIKDGKSSYQAFLKCQHHSISLGIAFTERVVLEAFLKGIEGTADPDLRGVLSKLAQLFALHTIETHKGWYLENDYISGGKSKAIRRLVDKLCLELRPEATALVEAFRIPEECLGAEIIKDSGSQ